MPPTTSFGVIGLAVMGGNLALNLEEKGLSVAIYNRKTEKMDRLLAENPGKKLVGKKDLADFVAAIGRPRPILLMVQAGPAVDEMIGRLAPLLEPGDVIIDGGNSWFLDTRRREAELRGRGLHFVGLGVSGGEEGARHGPALMPGGSAEAYAVIAPALSAIAAQTDSGACVTHVGTDGAGHFVKMTHNGVEYGDMQLIAEVYDLMRKVLKMPAAEIAQVFADWNRGELESFLIELTGQVLAAIDPATGRPLVDLVLDQAGQKGTGKWTEQVALDLGAPVPTIAAALFGRLISAAKDERVAASQALIGPAPAKTSGKQGDVIEDLRQALLAAKICSYAQGMSLIRLAAKEYGWKIDLKEIARIWKGGCIIRARLLDTIMKAYGRAPELASLLLADEFKSVLASAQPGWRRTVALAVTTGVPVPAMAASLAYYDSYRAATLPQNLTQAQRDAFGAHTYQRVDDPARGFVHSDWLALTKQPGP